MKPGGPAKDIDSYISDQPESIREQLEQLRHIILSAAPKSKEVISYGMPAFKMNSVLVYFAGYKNHIGFYPTGSGIKEFEDELGGYKYSKGAIQFPLDKKLPVGLIKKIVKFRLKQDQTKMQGVGRKTVKK